MPKLNQIIAIEKGVKTGAFQALTEAHQQVQKPAPLSGISRTYQPHHDDGEKLPPEATKVQLRTQEIVNGVITKLIELFDVTATKDFANCIAKADIVVDGQTLATGIPATYLLFLEKQFVDLRTFVAKLPILDAAESWHYDTTADCYVTSVVQTTRTKKIPRNHVKAEATPQHPAQVDVYYEDVSQGFWSTVKFSGALPAARVNELLARVMKLQQAVKYAREEANGLQVERQQIGEKLFGYLFA